MGIKLSWHEPAVSYGVYGDHVKHIRGEEAELGFTYLDRYYLASPEKAILDTLYYRGVVPTQDELELDRVDFNLLLKMSTMYPQFVSRTVSNLSNQLPIESHEE